MSSYFAATSSLVLTNLISTEQSNNTAIAEVCYTARATTKQQVLDGINKLTLQTNEHGQYTHDAILLIQKGIQHVLVSQFNPSDPGKGMVKLLDDGDNILT